MPPVHPAMKHFMLADRYAVLGRVMTDPSRYDHKVYKWLTRGRTPIVEQTDIDTSRYTSRGLPVTPVKHEAKEGEQVDGVDLLSDVHAIPNLSKTSISIIINPTLGLPILRSLYPPSRGETAPTHTQSNTTSNTTSSKTQGPHAVWFQPGAADDQIKAYVREQGLEDKVVLEGCVLVSGDKARQAAGRDGGDETDGTGRGRL